MEGTTFSSDAHITREAGLRQETQHDLAVRVQEIAARCYERQRQTMEALSALLHVLLVSRDPVRTAEVWTDWHGGALERLTAEARDQRDLSLALARCLGDERALEPCDRFEVAGPVDGFSRFRAERQGRTEADDR